MGGDPEAFWRTTPKLYDIFVRGRGAHLRMVNDIAMSQAWHTAALTSRAMAGKRLPNLNTLLGPAKPKRRQSQREQMQAFKAWTLLHGGTIQ